MTALLNKLMHANESMNIDVGVGVEKLRQEAQKKVLQYGLPTLRDERWKYTSLKLLERREYPDSTDFDEAAAIQQANKIIGDLPSAGLVIFVGECCLLSLAPEWADSLSMLLSDASTGGQQALTADALVQDSSSDGFIWLNLTRATTGLIFNLPVDKSIEKPLHVVYLNQSNAQAWYLRHHWKLAGNSKLTIMEHQYYSGAGLGNIYRSIELGENSELNWLTVQQTGSEFVLLQHNHIQQQHNSLCKQLNLDLGARLARQETRVQLAEPEAGYRYAGLLLGQQRQHQDQHVQVNHEAVNCSSQQSYRTVLGGHARGVVNTAAKVATGADGSDVQQNTASMLLSNTAEMDAKPELEIYADEVVASHGATIGQLDEDAMFYLRSRGLNMDLARQMLVGGFVSNIVETIEADELRAYTEVLVRQQLEQML